MIKNAAKGGASVRNIPYKRRGASLGVPDGKTLLYQVRQSSWRVSGRCQSGYRGTSDFKRTDNDFGGVISKDGNTIYFHRGEDTSYSL